MDIGRIIKEQRNKLSLSQEELGDKIYVTRQTVSNWENNKSYPDIHSLVSLSLIFDMTIDNLVKGDLEIMEQKIEQHDIETVKRYVKYVHISYVGMLILFPLLFVGGFYKVIAGGSIFHWIVMIAGIAIFVFSTIFAMRFALKQEKIKKKYDVQTYRELVAFFKGEKLDEIEKIRESGKRPYQKVLILVVFSIVCLTICLIALWILFLFL